PAKTCENHCSFVGGTILAKAIRTVDPPLANPFATSPADIFKGEAPMAHSLPKSFPGNPSNTGNDSSKEPVPMSRRILIVEDNDLTRHQLQELLQTEPNVQVETANDGHKALRELTEQDYSIVLTDLRMPGLDGMQLIKEVQQRSLPVTIIVTTGHGSIDE